MKRVLLFALIGIFTLTFQALNAQTAAGSIKGTVLDEEYGEGVPFANVLLYKDDQFYSGVATDFDGRFHLRNVELGTYRLEIQYIGYDTIQKDKIKIKSDEILHLGKLVMNYEEVPPCPCPPFYEYVDIPTFSLNPWAPTYTFDSKEVNESPARP